MNTTMQIAEVQKIITELRQCQNQITQIWKKLENNTALFEKLYELDARIDKLQEDIEMKTAWISKLQRRLDNNHIHEYPYKPQQDPSQKKLETK